MPTAKTLSVSLSLAICLATVACNRDASTPAAAAAPPPAAVPIATLQEKPVEQASEFIAQLRSQRSATIQPEIDGVVTRIFVKPGDRVRPGSALVQINAEKQQAAVRSTEASRAGIEADLTYWRGQVKRLESLVGAGAISRQEFDQAQNSLRTAEARMAAVDAQVREGRVELGYYRVNAPQAGVVGDITLRLGDRVTPTTVITTIDDNSELEADIQVPLNRTPDLRIGLPVQMLDSEGKPVVTNPITFVAPRVDERTQTVLVKSVLRDAPPAMRAQQFARARIVWNNTPGLTVPLTAVVRINGLYFCYVAEQTDKGLVARQRPIEVGELIGNEYVVRSGLKAGDRIITSGIQKLGNGAPVKPE
ncbi:MAG: efflux RND transporter periplasmic adaptor subunit [Acidobacteriota bacterium]|nr:efflux RND transporter periplasmic adaptor subunit [Acidobacteriota bacterium]